jgi:hypothetical protein
MHFSAVNSGNHPSSLEKSPHSMKSITQYQYLTDDSADPLAAEFFPLLTRLAAEYQGSSSGIQV